LTDRSTTVTMTTESFALEGEAPRSMTIAA